MKAEHPAPYAPLQTNYALQLKVLTPVHTGVGKEGFWTKSVDFFQQKGRVWVIDTAKLYQKLHQLPNNRGGSLLDTYTELLAKGDKVGIERLLLQEQIDLSSLSRYDFEYKGETSGEIQPQMRTGKGELYLPGTSLKGAIRSAVFTYLFERLRIKRYYSETEKALLGDFERSIFRYIRPADVSFPASELVDVFVLNLYREGIGWEIGWESDYKEAERSDKSFRLTLECLQVGSQASQPMRLSISTGFLNMMEKLQPRLLPTHLRKIIPPDDPIQLLFDLLNSHARRHIRKELEFFRTYDQAEDVDRIIDELESLLQRAENPTNSCVLRLGWGSGFHAITGDWRFEDHLSTIQHPDTQNLNWDRRSRQKKPTRYKSRRLAEAGAVFAPMGFVELSLS